MALKSSYSSEEKGAEIEESLEALEKLIDRIKVLYEQYFMGIQKQAPSHLHNECERRLRDLAQMQIRNTALRYRFLTVQQKYGSYNTYWKRTLREIEAGRYIRNLIKVKQKALATGEEIPEEIVAKMPKRMRDAIARDRELALAKAIREGALLPDPTIVASAGAPIDTQRDIPRFPAPRDRRDSHGRFQLDADDDEDIASALAALTEEAVAAIELRPQAAIAPPRAAAARPATLMGLAALQRPPPPEASSSQRGDTEITARVARDSLQPAPSMIAGLPSPAAPAKVPAPAPAKVPAPAPAASPVPGMSEADTRALYAKYVKARSMVGDKSDPMSYDRLVRTLSSQAPKILEQHRATGVEFNVVIKDNKVVLKARPK